MNNGKINSKIKLSNIFRYFIIRNFEIPKYWSFYILSSQILTPTQKLANFEIVCRLIIFLFSELLNFELFLIFQIQQFKIFNHSKN